MPEATDRASLLARKLLVLVVYAVLALLLFRGAWAAPSVRNIGGPGDPPFTMWMLQWTPYALGNGMSPLFTDHLNYPFGVNLMWNALTPLHSLVLWPVTATAGPVVAYNVFITANVALSAWCMFLALRRFVPRTMAAAVGGLLYGFSPYMLAQSIDHPTLTAAYIPPLLLVLLHEILVKQSGSALRAGGLLGLAAAVQLFIAEEMLAIEVLVAFLGLVLLVALHPRAVGVRVRHAAKALGTAAGVFLPLTSWALWAQFFGPQRLSGGSVQPANFFVSDVANFVVPTTVQELAPRWALTMNERWTGNLSEWDAYIGLPLLLVLIAGTVRMRQHATMRLVGLLALVLALLSMGPNLHLAGHDTGIPLPWRLFSSIPLVNHILPARLMLFAYLMIALLVAIFVQGLLDATRWKARAMGMAGTAAVAVTLLPTLSYPSYPMLTPRYFTDGSARRIPEGSVALIAPMQRLFPAEPMLWQAATNMRFKMPQGYFIAPDDQGHPRYGAPTSTMSTTMTRIRTGDDVPVTPALLASIAQDLTVRKVETVVVGPMENREGMLQLFGLLFDAAPQTDGGVSVWYDVPDLLRSA